jgi:hypothetical protein
VLPAAATLLPGAHCGNQSNDEAESQPLSFGTIVIVILLQSDDRDLGGVLDREAVADR